ncbi:MinD/ParA family protein [Pectinatus sottacetonis]|uniref:MinD/ParA family protein n=1 Tax=Pectinatus sottacetonis TaxID=1002795 RepID=UPI0018C7D9EE|nr:MinD/ParA family protein [Pectinatus sottacetonis]
MIDQASKLRKMIEHKKIYGSSHIHDKSSYSPRIIAVTSGKGGVGKTNFTVNLAIALSRLGKKVLIIDADLGLANVEVIMGCLSPYTMMDLLNGNISLEEIILKGPAGIQYISGGSGLEQLSDLSIEDRSLLIHRLYACEEVADIILVDTGAGVGRNVLDFLIAANEIILLTTPEPTALTDAYAVIKAYMARSTVPNIKLVINKIYDKDEGDEVSLKLRMTAEKFLKVTIKNLGMVYDDHNMVNAIKKQIPLLLSYPDTIASKCISQIANSILHGGNIKIKRNWHDFLHRLIFSK